MKFQEFHLFPKGQSIVAVRARSRRLAPTNVATIFLSEVGDNQCSQIDEAVSDINETLQLRLSGGACQKREKKVDDLDR